MVNLLKRMVARYEADVGNFEKGMKNAGKAHDDFVNKTKRGAKEAGQAINETGDNVVSLKDKFSHFGGAATRHIGVVVTATNHMRAAMAGAATVTSGALAVALVTLADAAQQVENQLQGIGIESDEARKRIYALAIETRTPLEATVGLLRNIQKSLSTQSLDDTIRQVGTLNRLMTVGGLDVTRRSSVMLQFGQALQSGILAGDELRSLRESAPVELLQALAARAGGSIAQLRQLGTEGKLTTAVMIGALEDLEQVAKDKFGNFDMTVTESLSVFRTALIGSIGEIDKATGATDALSGAIAGAAGFLRDHTGALSALANATMTVAQVALIAAGSRGIAAVGASALNATANVRTFATSFVALNNGVAISLSAAAAMQALNRSLGSMVAMMGGPWGVAIAAGMVGLMAISSYTTSIAEDLDNADKALEDFGDNLKKYKDAQQELETDRNRLLEISKQISAAIIAQGTAAETASAAEVAAINARIAKNQELLDIYRAVQSEDLRRSRSSIEQAERELESRAKLATGIIAGTVGMFTGQTFLEGYVDELTTRSRSGERLNADELETLQLYARIRKEREDLLKAETEFAESAPGMANAHVRAWQAQQEAAQAAAKVEENALADLNKAYDERAAKLEKLYIQRAEAERRAATATDASARQDALRAVASADEQIEKLRDVEGRVEAARTTVTELNAAMAQTGGALDKDGKLRALIDEIEIALKEAEAAGKSLDEVRLTRLEGAINGATTAAQRLNIELRKAGSTDFDSLAERMKTGALPYASDVANARNADYYASSYGAARQAGTGSQDEELVRHAVRAAEELGIAAQDLLSVIMLESKGDPTAKGTDNKGRTYEGLIQFDAYWRKQLGVNRNTPIAEQFDAIIRYMKENGVRPKMPLENVYASVSAGEATLTSRGDKANGGIVGNISEFTNGPQMEPYKAMAQGLLSTYGDIAHDSKKAFEDAEEAAKDAERERERAAREQERDDERRRERQKEYLQGLTDQNEVIALQKELQGKSLRDQEVILRTHERLKEAQAEGLDLNQRVLNSELTLREAITQQVKEEVAMEDRRAMRREVERQQEEEYQKRAQREQERLNERVSHQEDIQEGIRKSVVATITKTGDWRDILGQVIMQMAEAYLYSGLFNKGPMGVEGGGKGLIGAGVDLVSSWFSANGNVMTDRGPIPLKKYAYGGIARSPQLSIFGEGRTPEAYVPLPDGRTIPVTIKTPDVPSFAGVGAGNGLLRVELDLNNDMLEGRIVETSTPVAASVTRRGIDNFSKNELPSQVKRSQRDPSRTQF